MSEFSEYDDIIDTSDVAARIVEIREELDLDENNDPFSYLEDEEQPEPLPEDQRADLEEELRELNELKAEVERYSGGRFEDGITMIAESYFEEYAKEYAEDLHGEAVRNAHWPFDNIDWELAANDLKQDYTEVTFRTYDFWVR